MREWWEENKVLAIIFVVLLCMNLILFNNLFLNKTPDLKIDDVVHNEEEGVWKIIVSSTRIHPRSKADVIISFQDGTVKREKWQLNQKNKSWEYQVPVEAVIIKALDNLDTYKRNNYYRRDPWSEAVALSRISRNAIANYAVSKDKKIYTVFAEFEKSGRDPGLYLEKFDSTGELVFGPYALSSGKIATSVTPLIHLLEEQGNTGLLTGWNIQSGDGIKAEVLKITSVHDEKEVEVTPVLIDQGISSEEVHNRVLFDGYFNQDENYLLLMVEDEGEYRWEVLKLNGSKVVNKFIAPGGQGVVEDVKYARLIADEEGLNIFWVQTENWNYALLHGKVSPTGQILKLPAKITNLKITFSLKNPVQIIRAQDGLYHLATISSVRSMRISRQLDYLIFDDKGKVIKDIKRFMNIGGYCTGFHLTATNDGNLELYTSQLAGRMLMQPQVNTEIFRVKYTPELEPITPFQRVVNTTYYDDLPVHCLTDDGEEFLFWTQSREEGLDICYKTTDDEIKIKLAADDRSMVSKTVARYSYPTFVALLLGVVFSIIPVLGLFLFNRYNKKQQFLFWVSALFLMFMLKVYMEIVMTKLLPLLNVVLPDIYQFNLLGMLLILVITGLYWFTKKGREIKTGLLNRVIVFWYFLDFFTVYYLYIARFFI